MRTKEKWRKKAYLEKQRSECDFRKFYNHSYQTANDTIFCFPNFFQIILKTKELMY